MIGFRGFLGLGFGVRVQHSFLGDQGLKDERSRILKDAKGYCNILGFRIQGCFVAT